MSDMPVQPLATTPPIQQDSVQIDPQQPVQSMPNDQTVAMAQTLGALAQPSSLNPPQAVGSRAAKEQSVSGGSLDGIVQEVPGASVIETEKSAEIPPELESYIEKVEHHEIAAPQKIVVADDTTTALTGNYAAEPVVVLPLTQQKAKQGLAQSVSESIRWLAEWCMRVIKKFHGTVVYRDIEEAEEMEEEERV